MKLPAEFERYELDSLFNAKMETMARDVRLKTLEWIVRDCVEVVAQESCGEDKPYDFIQGWEAALDLAEQAILKRYGLKEKI